MKRIDRLLLTSSVPPFLASFLIAMFVLLMQTLWLYIDDIAGKGLSLFLVVELLAYKCVALIPLAMPIGVLISSVMVLGNLAEHYELSSFKSAGVSLIRVMQPVLLLGVFAAFFSYYCANYLMPIANLKFGSRMYDIQRQKPALRLDVGVFNYDFQGYAIHIGSKGPDGRSIREILIYDHNETSGNEFSQIVAEEGEMYATRDGQYFVMNLRNGHQYIETRPGRSRNDNYPFVRTSFDSWTKIFDLGEFQLSRTDEELFKSNRSMLTIPQLYDAVDSLDRKILEREKNFYNLVAGYFQDLERDSAFLPKTEERDTSQTGDSEEEWETEGEGPPDKAADTVRVNQRPGAPVFAADLPGSTAEAGDSAGSPEALTSGRVSKPVKPRNIPKPVKDDIPNVDSLEHFADAFKNMPVYERKRLYNKAKTFARSIEQQSEAAERFLQDLRISRVKHLYDLNTKYGMAVVCFVFVFIGAPMGAIIRKGGFGYPILISIVFFMLFVVLTIFCRKIAETFVIPATWAAWIPIGVLLPIGLLLTYRAMNDSKMLNVDRYTQFLLRVFKKKELR